jgi:hypothetical protein
MRLETEHRPDPTTGVPGLDSAAVTLYRWTIVHERLTPASLAQAASDTGLSLPECRHAARALSESCLFQELPPTGGTEPGPAGWQPVSPQAATAQLLSDREVLLRVQEEALRNSAGASSSNATDSPR